MKIKTLNFKIYVGDILLSLNIDKLIEVDHLPYKEKGILILVFENNKYDCLFEDRKEVIKAKKQLKYFINKHYENNRQDND